MMKKNNILPSIYFTAGFPELESTNEIIRNLIINNVSLIEIGFPFSDPLADGPTIQHSSEVALKNGMSLEKLFEQLAKLPTQHNAILTLMGYLNPVLNFGLEKFLSKASSCGISGIILPDLPIKTYVNEYRAAYEKYDIKPVFLVTPETSLKRLQEIDSIDQLFVYAVTQSSITGNKLNDSNSKIEYLTRLHQSIKQNQIVAGFGIQDNETFQALLPHCEGVIIGSAFIKHIQEYGTGSESIKQFLSPFTKKI